MASITSLPLSVVRSIIEREIIEFVETPNVQLMGISYPEVESEEFDDDSKEFRATEILVAHVSVSGSKKFKGMNGEHNWHVSWDTEENAISGLQDFDQTVSKKDQPKFYDKVSVYATNTDKGSWKFKDVKLIRPVHAICIDLPYAKMHHASLPTPATTMYELVEFVQQMMKEWEGDIVIPHSNDQLVIAGINVLPGGAAEVEIDA